MRVRYCGDNDSVWAHFSSVIMMIILSAVDMVMSPRLICNDNEKVIKDIEEIKKRVKK